MPRRPRQLRGFTLIELLLVIIIISIMLAMAIPTMRGWGQGQKMRNSVDSFIAATGYARSLAVTNATPYSVEIDSSANTYVVKSIAADGTKKAAPGDFGQASTLPESFTIRLLSGGGVAMTADGQPIPGGGSTGTLIFYPDARSTPGVVEIKSPNGEVVQIESKSPAEPFKQAETKS